MREPAGVWRSPWTQGRKSRMAASALLNRVAFMCGSRISGARKTQITQAHEHVKSGSDLLIARLDGQADDVDEDEATSGSKAAAETQTEPAPDHSAASSLLDSNKGMIPA